VPERESTPDRSDKVSRLRLLERIRVQTPLPLRRPRRELLVLVLVAVAALTPLYAAMEPDSPRLCLSGSIVRGKVTIDNCIGDSIDRASYGGHVFTDKAPGMSILSIPAVEALRLPYSSNWTQHVGPRIWGIRVLTSGIGFLIGVLLLGRLAEGLAPGWGGATAVTFGLGSLAAPLAATTFGHVTAGTLAFGAFILAWGRRPGLAGLAAGSAVVVEYQTGLIGVVLAAYVALAGIRPLARYAAGAIPPLALLGFYDQVAFGSPFHLSYRYVANDYAGDQASGFFGIGIPRLHSIQEVFVGKEGILVVMPVVVAAAAGLIVLSRRYPLEALVCGAVTAIFLLLNVGYFLPYGGTSPGPRFLIPALPFLYLGLASAFAARPRITAALSAVSIVAMTLLTLTWASAQTSFFRQGVWGELARLPFNRAASPLVIHATKNVATLWTVDTKGAGMVLVAVAATAAWLIAVVRRPETR